MVKNKRLVAEAYEWDEEDMSSDDNDMTKVKVLMALADDENVAIGKESARNGEWVKISMRKVHILLDMEDSDKRKSFLEYLCIDLNYVEDEQITNQKKRILGLNQLTEDPSHSGQTYLVFLKYLAEDTKVSIPGVEQPWLSEAEGFTLPNHDTGRIIPAESQVKIPNPSVAITDSSATEYDSAVESLVYSTPLPPLEKLARAKPISGLKTIKSILKSNSTFKLETLKGVNINEPSSAPAKGNKNVSTSKRNSAPTGKLKNVKIEDNIPFSIVMKELNDLKLQISKNQTCDHPEYMSTMNMTPHLKSQGGFSSRSKTSRPLKPFPPCIHYGFNDNLSDDCVNYPICDTYGSYDHDTHGHNKIISLRRGIKPRNPQQVIKSYETYGSTAHTTINHNDIEWFRRGEAL
ncbi:hypothetical protein Tco_0409581 [Tanacetum coccineum]